VTADHDGQQTIRAKGAVRSALGRLGTALVLAVFATGAVAPSNADEPPLDFGATFVPDAGLTVSFGDLNGDGWLETAMTRNDGHGNLSLVPNDSIGLGDLVFRARDARLADFDGDGVLDLVTNCYRDLADPGCVGRLFRGRGDGSFTEDGRFADLDIRGYGETIVVADFDNDGDADIFFPQYSSNYPQEHSYLLINGPGGLFTDVADRAGVSLRNRPFELRPEGAQAVDFDGDGWIDLYVSGHFFFNNGDLTFTDRREVLGLPELFEEGMKFLDWNNDGRIDLILHHPDTGPRLFEFDGSRFVERAVFSPQTYSGSYGCNVHDLDNDGLEDLITNGAGIYDTIVHRNEGGHFVRVPVPALDPLRGGWGAPAFADIDRDGRIDLALSDFVGVTRVGYFLNRTANQNGSFTVEVLGNEGATNQFGRVVRASPVSRPDVVFTRVVDGGSGYMSQNQYPLLVGTPFLEPHRVEVRYSDRTVQFDIVPGAAARVQPDGTVSLGGAGDQPSVWVSGARVREGKSGTTKLAFMVTVFGQSTGDVSVDWATEDGTATAGSDYAAASGNLLIPAGSSTGTIEVSLNGDTVDEGDETLVLRASNAVNATLRTPAVTGTILDDDKPPRISVTDANVIEGNSDITVLTFTVELSEPYDRDVTVAYATADGTASAGNDYTAASGMVTFPAGSTAQPLPILVTGDISAETDEDFFVNLTAPSNATIDRSQGRAVIVDDEGVTAAGTLIPDGRAVSRALDLKGDAYRANVVAGRTYVVEVETPVEGAVPGSPQPVLSVNGADGTPLASSPTNRSSCDSASLVSAVVTRLSFTPSSADVAGGPLTISLTDPLSSGYAFRIRLMETTMYAARWSVNGYRALISLQNTTGCAIGGEIELVNAAGTTVMTIPFSLVGAGSTQLEILSPPEIVGSARLRHDGPSGAIVGGIYMVQSAGGGSGNYRWPFIETRTYGSTDGK
jgi:hypothetical protein